jgi:pimeloyl-ACP methyl ester carboxylesterase
MISAQRKLDDPLTDPQPDFLALADGRRLAYHHQAGAAPGVLFCGGFRSDMTGQKATTLAVFCERQGLAYTRFDYTGHGASSGEFAAGTIGAWTADALAIVDQVTAGPLLVVGSSMGGWIMLLLALARPERVAGLVGIAPGPDFTEELIWQQATDEQRRVVMAEGQWWLRSTYDGSRYTITRALIEDGRKHLLLGGPIAITCPVHLLHGQRDPDVPWQTSLRLAERLASENVTIELIKAGDHRLSTPADLERLCAAVARLAAAR